MKSDDFMLNSLSISHSLSMSNGKMLKVDKQTVGQTDNFTV